VKVFEKVKRKKECLKMKMKQGKREQKPMKNLFLYRSRAWA
jgi:hypothetical protein